jgi:cystathionine gamma-synthase
MKIETRAVHAGRHIDPATGAVTQPICLSTTFERSPEGEYPRGYIYSRDNNPNRRALEECLADLEGGQQALAFSSGLAVATAVVQGLEAGAHILAPDDVYWGFRKVVGGVFERWPVEATYVDMTDLDAVRAAIRPNTRLIWVETPSNPLMKITDLAAIAKLAQSAPARVMTVCDGTFATPVLQRPLELGIDMVAHSTTKYIGGHSDVIGGALIAGRANELFERARLSQKYGGSWRRCTIRDWNRTRDTRSPPGRCRHSGVCSPSRFAAGGTRRWEWQRAASCSFAPRVWAAGTVWWSIARRWKGRSRERHRI